MSRRLRELKRRLRRLNQLKSINKDMTVDLNISERLYALNVLNGFKGNVDLLASILEDIRQFVITEEEWKAVEKVEDELPDGNKQWRWDDTKADPKSIELTKETAKYIVSEIDKKSDSGELTLQDKAVISLRGKLTK